MTERSNAISSTLMLLEILRIIPKGNGRFITVNEIRKKLSEAGLDVKDKPTTQRHLKTLSEHFEIEVDDRGTEYAYRWKEKAKGLEVSTLTPQESLLLMLAEEHLKMLLPANIMKSMKPFFDEARYQKQFGAEKLEYKWLDKVCSVPTSLPLLPAKIQPEIFEAVSLALFENRWLEVEYQNQQGSKKQASVMPLALAQQGATTYLVVRYKGFENERLLALHRVKKAVVSTFRFDRPKDFSLKKYQAEGHLGFGNGEMVRLTFKIKHWAGFHLTETKLSTDQVILEEGEDYYIIQATVPDNDMLTWWIRRFGEDIEVLEKVVVEK